MFTTMKTFALLGALLALPSLALAQGRWSNEPNRPHDSNGPHVPVLPPQHPTPTHQPPPVRQSVPELDPAAAGAIAAVLGAGTVLVIRRRKK